MVGGGDRIEGSNKKEKGLMDMDNSVVIAGARDVRGINGNEKKYNKIFKRFLNQNHFKISSKSQLDQGECQLSN